MTINSLFLIALSITICSGNVLAKKNHDYHCAKPKKFFYALKRESYRRASADQKLEAKLMQTVQDLEKSEAQVSQLNQQLLELQVSLTEAKELIELQEQLNQQLQQTVNQFASIIETQTAAIERLDQKVSNVDIADLDNRVEKIETNTVLELDGYLKLHPEDSETALFQGINVQIVNNGFTTDSIDGTGNLILGFNEINPVARAYCSEISITDESACVDSGFTWSANKRLGSHNLVLGRWNDYINFGGIVGGEFNKIAGSYSMVLGGILNETQSAYSTILGGSGNKAQGLGTTISGGEANRTIGVLSSIAGGFNNRTKGNLSTISGGINLETTRSTEWLAGPVLSLE